MKKIPIVLIFILAIVLLYYLNTLQNDTYFSGSVENHNAYIGSKIGGRVAKIYKKEGDSVHQGEVIVAFQSQEQSLKVSILQAKLKQIELQTHKMLQNPNYNAKDIDILQAQIDEIRANLDLAKLTLDECNVTAPIDAVIERIAVEVGDMITPQKGIIELSFPTKKYAKFYIPETKLLWIKVGDSINIHVDGSDKIYQATITSISQNAEFTPKNIYTQDERANLLFGVKAKVQEEALKSGMMIEVRLP